MYVKHARATAKQKLNGVKQVCLTCQADVNLQPAGQKCQVKHGRETNGVSHVYQTCQADVYLSIYLSDLSIYLSVYLSIHQNIYLSTNQSIYLSLDRSL